MYKKGFFEGMSATLFLLSLLLFVFSGNAKGDQMPTPDLLELDSNWRYIPVVVNGEPVVDDPVPTPVATPAIGGKEMRRDGYILKGIKVTFPEDVDVDIFVERLPEISKLLSSFFEGATNKLGADWSVELELVPVPMEE